MTMHSTRPDSHSERDQVLRATDPKSPPPGLDEAALPLLARIFGAPREAYAAARTEHAAATARYLEAATLADAADDTFDTAFRKWTKTVTRADGKAATQEIAALLNSTLPSALVDLPYAAEITKTQGLLDKLPADLQGDAQKLAELKAALAALEPLVKDQEQKGRAKLAAGAKLAQASIDFDTAYGKLVKAYRGLLGDDATFAVLPRFLRRGRNEKSATSDG
jgi:hypothetical protein